MFSERTHRAVIRIHHRRGDRAAALQAYRRCEDILARELWARRPRSRHRTSFACWKQTVRLTRHEAILADIPRPLQLSLHKRTATFLEAEGADPVNIALHWEGAGMRERAAPYLLIERRPSHGA